MVIDFYYSTVCLVTNLFALEVMEGEDLSGKKYIYVKINSLECVRTKQYKLKNNENVNNLTNMEIFNTEIQAG